MGIFEFLQSLSLNPYSAEEKAALLQKQKETQQLWDGFTSSNPCTADPDNFGFIVHGVSPDINHKDKIKYVQGEKNKNSRISCSLIGVNKETGIKHLETFGSVGYIIKVPMQNLVTTSYVDFGSGNTADMELVERTESLGPTELLEYGTEQGPGGFRYNEILVRSVTEHGSAEVIGIFAQHGYEFMGEELAEETGLPLFILPEKDKRIDIESQGFVPAEQGVELGL